MIVYTLRFDTEELVPTEFKGKATKDDKGFFVKVDLADKVTDFRDNNIRLSKQVEQLTEVTSRADKLRGDKTLDDLEAELAELRAVSQKVKDGSLKGSDAVETEVTRRTEAMKKANDDQAQALQREIHALKQKNGELDAVYRRSVVTNAINLEIQRDSKLGINPQALPDVLGRAYSIFQVDEKGVISAKDSAGQTIWGEDGATPMSITEWFKRLREEAGYYFMQSSGGGAGGGSNQGSGGLSADQIAKLSPQEKMRLGRLANAKKK